MPVVEMRGKRNLFLSGNNLNEDHRLMEKVTTIIEAQLRDDGSGNVLAHSSIQVLDIAGGSRELDVAFTRASRPEEVFASVEVKHHGKKVGPGFVEEVVGKRLSVRIADATLVSTSGFTKNTPALAAKHGLTLRTLKELDAADADWFEGDHIRVETEMLRLNRVALITVDSAGVPAAVELMADDLAVKSLVRIDWPSAQPSVDRPGPHSPIDLYRDQITQRLGEIPPDEAVNIRLQGEPGDRPRPQYGVTLASGEQRLVPVVMFNAT
jgi:hypothetical protein